MKKIQIVVVLLMSALISGCGLVENNKQPEDVSDINNSIENVFTVETFPYYYSESEKLIDCYKEVMEGGVDDYCYLEVDKKNQYKYTINTSNYLYFGKLKKNYPDGLGVIFRKIGDYDIYGVYAIADFDNGYINGYALCYELQREDYSGIIQICLQDEYEGEYEKGKISGNGITYVGGVVRSDNGDEELNEHLYSVNISGFEIISGVPMLESAVLYIGEHDGYFSGEGTLYQLNGKPRFVGKFEHDVYIEGRLYNDDGSILYEGEFKNGKYHGDGTLYNADGSVKYKGKFEKGDIK